MKNTLYQLFAINLLVVVINTSGFSQERISKIESKLELLSQDNPALQETVDVSVTDVSIQEFLRGIARNVNLNITIDPALQFTVVNNFSDVRVIDILVFFCKEYELDIIATGSILSIIKHELPEVEVEVKKPAFVVVYEEGSDLLTLDIKKDTLSKIVHAITDQSGKNIILESGISHRNAGGYIKGMPFDNALDKFAFANSLRVKKTDDNFYILSELELNNTGSGLAESSKKKSNGKLDVPDGVFFNIKNRNNISIRANNVSVYDIIKTISDSLKINYTILSDFKDNASVNLINVSYDDFIKYVLEGTDFRHRIIEGVYLVGGKNDISIHNTEIVYLKHRTVEKLTEIIPSDMKTDVELIEFTELNALFITGHPQKIEKVKAFVVGIDSPIPVVLIEVLIVDIYKRKAIATGIQAGFGESPARTNQTILPGIDYQFSTKEINSLFGKINGIGWINLGQVSPDFYLAIQAMEENELLKIKSTPKLSTLNGHSALLTSGETRYYKEERNNYIGTQNPALSSSYTWKPINADLSISIKPIVSEDEHITLEIEVNQAEFQPNGEENAPPGSITRGFKSLIRMKDQEMILLGGLDKVSTSKKGKGTPFLSRVPVIKWFFSSRNEAKTENKLSIFIQPTVIY